MLRKERGLPEGFGIAVPQPPPKRTPVKLDDYLEREIQEGAKPLPAAPVGQRSPATEPPLGARDTLQPTPHIIAAPQPPPPQARPVLFPQRLRQRSAPQKPPRAQVNMTPEVHRMMQALVQHFSTYGLQKDTSASELIDALVTALHEARDQLDLSNVPPHGHWGTPTARAFRTSLKNAIIDAIARHHERRTA